MAADGSVQTVPAETLRTPVNGVYQWYVGTSYRFPEAVGESWANAYLWIPECCTRVRGSLLLFRNIIDEGVAVDPAIRAACEAHDLAIVWIGNYIFGRNKDGKDVGTPAQYCEFLESVFAQLARVSGYDELSNAPWLPLGQSAELPMLGHILRGRPARCLAQIAMKDPWYNPEVNAEVPILNTKGTGTSWDQGAAERGNFLTAWNRTTPDGSVGSYVPAFLAKHATYPQSPASFLMEGWSSHFGAPEPMMQFIASYIRSAAAARLPEVPGGPLRPVDVSTGWVTGLPIPVTTNGRQPFLPIPYAQATPAQRAEAWFFTEELARRAYDMAAIVRWDAASQMPAVVDAKGQVYPHTFRGLQEITPEITDDSLTFHLGTTLLDALPSSFAVDPGHPLSKTVGKPFLYWMQGCAVPLKDDLWQLSLSRATGTKAEGFLAVYKGPDETVRGVEQPVHIKITPNTEGAEQTITFDRIPDLKAGSVPSIRLSATASSGLKVRYYVNQGPVVLDGDMLRFTALPPRAKKPLKVTVTAWQWGLPKQFKTAATTSQSFHLTD